MFGFSIGINVTMAVFLGSPRPLGFEFSQTAIAGMYGTPLVYPKIDTWLYRPSDLSFV